jgi:hypothetical protein
MEIKEGMVGLSGGGHFLQKGIKLFLSNKFSHSFVTFKVDGIISALETTSTIVCPSPFYRKDDEENYIEMWELVNDFERDMFKRTVLLSYCVYSATWYSYLSYFWFMYRWFMRLFKIEKTKMWNWCSSGVTCTELTCFPLKKIHPNLFSNDLNTYTVDILRKIMLANPDKFRCLGWYKEV